MMSLSQLHDPFDAAVALPPRAQIMRHDGEVLHGAKLGRTIGFPTANISLGLTPGPKRGIYAAKARTSEGELHDAVAYFGARPTVDGVGDLLEVFLFDFDGDLYGSVLTVVLLNFVRQDEAFTSLEAMRAQIARDCAAARELLADWQGCDVGL
jgi:riboflavin kinase/FMN adenylyltransferase